jgi:hypothetical protein
MKGTGCEDVSPLKTLGNRPARLYLEDVKHIDRQATDYLDRSFLHTFQPDAGHPILNDVLHMITVHLSRILLKGYSFINL